MKTLRTLSFCIGFTMLFFAPMDAAGIKSYFILWLPLSVILMWLGGAFKSTKLWKHRH